MELVVHRLCRAEVYRDLARIPQRYRIDRNGHAIEEGQVRRIRVALKTAYVILRGDTASTEPTIRLDDKVREKLGIHLGQKYDVVIERVCFAELRWAWGATEIGYRLATRLAVVSLVLGFIGFLPVLRPIARGLVRLLVLVCTCASK